ncbi:MAG: hypothetical protein ABIO39_01150 [Caulobacteraceae bacterium]
MSKLPFLSIIAASTLAGSGFAAHAQPRVPPQESLGGSCRDVQTLNTGYITAECRDDRGRYRWSTIYGPQCRNEVSNENGVMACRGAEARAGSYSNDADAQSATTSALIGALAGAVLGGVLDRDPYQAGDRHPVWGEPGYGDPARDARFGPQGWGQGANGQWVPVARRQAWLERRIARGEQDGSVTRAEAASLRGELRQLERLEARYERAGLTNRERADLDQRFDALGGRIQVARNDSDSQWVNINQRQKQLDARIDAGLNDGSLTRREARSLRSDFNALERSEADYRRGGLNARERAELDRRFDTLSARIRDDRHDDQQRWQNINQRQAALDARIDAGVRDRSLTAREAARLRSEFRAIARMETQYRRNGLTAAERADLDRRFDGLSARIRESRS